MPAISPDNLALLKEPILSILRGSDLSLISAKKVRQALEQLNDPKNPNEKLLARLQIQLEEKEHKKQVDELIKVCFDTINNPAPAPTPATGLALPVGNGHSNGYSSASAPNSGASSAPRLALPGMGGIPGSLAAPSAPVVKTEPRSSSSMSTSKAAPSGGKRSRKAEDTISDEEEDADVETIKKMASKKTTKKRKSIKNEDGEKKPPNPNNPFNRPVILSEEMGRVCGGREMPRYMITKQLWAYIKGNDLQNPENKRQIMCDSTLQSLFGKSTVDSFEMAKLISKHVSKKEVTE
ncbi:SWIB-domain-containing protein [Meira miltonrushii]|uniref:SWIB-domain-containing protein n=1 Tax=Meira miltonrushii TaxID=1280837 RepID=A0A316VDP5_9BASI|nr:SWIB-domain-containing protein [Meira miltonrushii]PWN35692.1 SWIB-domain-containing protein [Meira miltonrushii]